MSAKDEFREHLARAIEKLGMSQQELSRKSGVHFVTINRILQGTQEPTLTNAEKLAQAVGISLPKFFRTAS